jgi:hypothetical protein
LLCFLDASLGYHQIKMAMEDEEKMPFITPVGCYCYTCMLFQLKNVGGTFQRAIVRPQNRYLADSSDPAKIRTISILRRPPT